MVRLVACVLLATVSTVAAGADSDVWRRGLKDPAAVVRALHRLARSRSCDAVLWVWDSPTFRPPGGRSAFARDHDYAADLPAWCAALGQPDEEGLSVHVAASTGRRVHEVTGDSAWQVQLEQDLAAWLTEPKARVAPAAEWTARLLKRVRARKTLLVLVASGIPPEAGLVTSIERDKPWHDRLIEEGSYWDEERIGRMLSSRSVVFCAVAPEARFGDFLPYAELPQCPWASRPVYPPAEPDFGAAGKAPRPPLGGDVEDALREAMRKHGVPEKQIEKVLGRDSEDEDGPDGRFDSETPRWYDSLSNGRLLFNTDCPSGYGRWPYARVAAMTGGQYVFYPFPPGEWADDCPYDGALLARLGPEMVSRKEHRALRSGDPVLDALCRAAAMVADVTPWGDSRDFHGRQGGVTWSSFLSAAPLVLDDRFRLRDCPFDSPSALLTGRAWNDSLRRQLFREGERLREALPRYDAAIGLLDRTARTGQKAHPRSYANLRLLRFHLEVSAFHLEALAIFFQELERFWSREPADGEDIHITYVPAIRLSDCLDGYHARTISPEEERKWSVPATGRGEQGNLLDIPKSNEKYRAKRRLEDVFAKLDARLVPRARRMVAAAEEVMAHEAKSPWGWVTYYSEAHTFVCEPIRAVAGRPERTGDRPPEPEPDRPTTPRGGGSSSGGPSSGGG